MIGNFKKVSFWIISLLLIVVIFFIISLILLAAHTNPLTFLNVIFLEPWKNLSYLSGFVNIFAILLLAGLSVAITFKYKIYNFGVPGQMLASAMVTFILAVAISKAGGSNRWIVLFLLLITIMIGALYGLVIAILKNYFKINEIISTILLNFIMWEGYKGMIASGAYQNQSVPEILSLRFDLEAGPLTAANLFSAGIIIALIILIVTILLFNNRTLGFKMNAVAKNPMAARQARINSGYQILKIMPISGAIAGLAGYLYFLATNNHLPKLDTMPQEGFYAIAIGALAFYEPLVIGFSTFLFTLFIRPITLGSFVYFKNPSVVVVILGVAIYLMGLIPFIWYMWDQSPFVQEKWFNFKRKLFNLPSPLPADIPGVTDNNKNREVKTLKLDLDDADKSVRSKETNEK